MEQIIKSGLGALAAKLNNKEVSATEVTQACLAQIKAQNPTLNAFLTVTEESALQQARNVDQKRAQGESVSALAGVPCAIKDNICTQGVKTTCASKMLDNFVPGYDATVVKKLKQADIILLGKTNMDEFAMGANSETSAFGTVKNPVDSGRVPGGSSGGSASAVASGCVPFALGTDTGGSIRQPASFCGIVGIKPTYGRVSRFGAVAYASSLDQIGPLANSVEDCAMVLNLLCGHDPADSTSAPKSTPDFTAELGQDIKGVHIALPKECMGEGLQPEVKEKILNAVKAFEKLGAVVEEVSMPVLQHALPAYYVISCAEASSNMGRFDGIHYGERAAEYENLETLYKNSRNEFLGAEVKRRIMLGTFVLSAGYYDAYYKKALQVRSLINQEYLELQKKYDVILSPTTPTVAYRWGEMATPLQTYMGDIYTVPANLTGLPALSLPCGKDGSGLPVGMQMIGKAFEESHLLRVAHAYEQARGEDAV